MQHPYENLGPEVILNAIDSTGLLTSGHLSALNSYENRVYQVGIEGQNPLIAKFYRPERWSDKSILQEHAFALALVEDELPVIAPLEINGETLFHHAGFRFALFPRKGGQGGHLEQDEDFRQMGRFLARMHQIGQEVNASARPHLNPQSYGHDSRAVVLQSGMLPPDLIPAYDTISRDCLALIDRIWAEHSPHLQLIHGDMHAGNILWRDDSFHLVDLDDCCLGPRMQDIFMLLNGETDQQQRQLEVLAEAYMQFMPFPAQQLVLIESLRTLRILKYAAWICQRWHDPAFPIAFPWFGQGRFWPDHILSLREQFAALQGPSLQLYL